MRLYFSFYIFFSIINAEKPFFNLLNRLFTSSSLDYYDFDFKIDHSLPDVKRETGRKSDVRISIPARGKPKLTLSGTSIADTAYCFHQFCIENFVSFLWHEIKKKNLPVRGQRAHLLKST